MKSYLAIVLLGTGIAIPGIGYAQQANPPANQQAAADECDRLIAALNVKKSETLPVTMEQARAYKTSGNSQACRQANDQLQAAANGQPTGGQQATGEAGKILVQQAAPKVTVEQSPADVTVSQGQPQIIIHQPAPTITVDIPQPDVVVRMPAPQVAVQQEKPRVEVQQAKPEVVVNQADQGGAAKVNLQNTGQPAVQYQSDQPKVVINKPQGEPKIRFEQMTSSGGSPASQGGEQANAGTDQTGQAADQTAGQSGMQQLQVSQIKKMPVVNDGSENLGTVESVVVKSGTSDGYIILRAGQFLGIGDRMVSVPFNNVWIRGNQLVITGLSKDQIASLPEWKSSDTNFKALADDQMAKMKTAG